MLQLLPRQRFILTLSDGIEIPGKFGTTATALFGSRKNLLLSEINQKIISIKNAGSDNVEYDLYLQELLDYILCACEAAARETGSRFTFNSAQLGSWADDYYYETKEPNVLIKLFSHSFPQYEKKNQELTVAN
jgi:hypothetical protein